MRFPAFKNLNGKISEMSFYMGFSSLEFKVVDK